MCAVQTGILVWQVWRKNCGLPVGSGRDLEREPEEGPERGSTFCLQLEREGKTV